MKALMSCVLPIVISSTRNDGKAEVSFRPRVFLLSSAIIATTRSALKKPKNPSKVRGFLHSFAGISCGSSLSVKSMGEKNAATHSFSNLFLIIHNRVILVNTSAASSIIATTKKVMFFGLFLWSASRSRAMAPTKDRASKRRDMMTTNIALGYDVHGLSLVLVQGRATMFAFSTGMVSWLIVGPAPRKVEIPKQTFLELSKIDLATRNPAFVRFGRPTNSAVMSASYLKEDAASTPINGAR
mmetsp:Transcript_29227/g.44191  ORF Transcript_29227/g.44191 Transcript_29227/m.44191 type:complete len:241 (-) Transcript_29227:1638-2360(-)